MAVLSKGSLQEASVQILLHVFLRRLKLCECLGEESRSPDARRSFASHVKLLVSFKSSKVAALTNLELNGIGHGSGQRPGLRGIFELEDAQAASKSACQTRGVGGRAL